MDERVEARHLDVVHDGRVPANVKDVVVAQEEEHVDHVHCGVKEVLAV